MLSLQRRPHPERPSLLSLRWFGSFQSARSGKILYLVPLRALTEREEGEWQDV